ncbi:alpha/beta fold hydrolase [Thalassospira sp. MA62]|nr:alpha/beta fold hydrolase [Thalassospira sp. MA62]
MFYPDIKQTTRAALLLGVAVLMTACAGSDPQFSPSGNAISAPRPKQTFNDYVETSRAQLRAVLSEKRFDLEEHPFGDYSLDQIVEMREPFLDQPDQVACNAAGNTAKNGAGTGFLLVHGLTDSPYWLGDIRAELNERFPCATLYGVLLPGHGTVPGDLIDVNFEDWLATVRFAVQKFDQDIDHIIPIGFSTGAALIGRDIDSHRDDDRFRAMILLSPGFEAKSGMAGVTPYARYVRRWVGQGENNDPAKYGSMAMNGAAEFHLLTAPYRDGTIGTFDLPAFVVISSDDQTVKPEAAVEFFCNKVQSDNKEMIWYQGAIAAPDSIENCDGIDVVASANAPLRTLNHAHTAITLSPDNPVYGVNGTFHACGHYSNADDLKTCQTGNSAQYGELNLLETVEPGTLRRGTFNPDFSNMIDKMAGFIRTAITAP